MSGSTQRTPRQRALLIGVGHYAPPLIGTKTVKDLEGAINDVLAMREYLTGKMGVAEEHITTLLSPIQGKKPRFSMSGLDFERPTYESIVKAFEKLAGPDSTPGDLVYIHYSGHGARSTTVFPHLKANDEQDESIVPWDIECGGRLLRDVEIGALLQDIVATKATITVVFDSCHSGGALRGPHEDEEGLDNAIVRAIDGDFRAQSVQDLPHPAIMARINKYTECAKWMRHTRGVAFLAACTSTQKAWEKQIDGHQHGVLTHWLLHTLQDGPAASPAHLPAEVVRLLTDNGVSLQEQTPQLLGDRWRFFFGEEVRPKSQRVFVKRVEKYGTNGGRAVILDAGSVQQVRRLSTYSILARNMSAHDSTSNDGIIKIKINTVSESEAMGFLETPQDFKSWEDIKPGCPAVLASLPAKHRAPVRLDFDRDSGLWRSSPNDPVTRLAETTWLRPWQQDQDGEPLLTMDVDANARYIIRGPSFPLLAPVTARMRRSPTINGQNDFETVLGRLEHLAKFDMIRRLETPQSLPNKALFSFCVKPAQGALFHSDLGRWLQPAPSTNQDSEDGHYRIPMRHLFDFEITNHTDNTLGLVILDIMPEFGVKIADPLKSTLPYAEIKPHKTYTSTFYVDVPFLLAPAVQGGAVLSDTFKIIACDPPQRLDSLQLPKMRKAEERNFRSGRVKDEEEALLEELSDGGCVRSGASADQPGHRFQVEDVRVLVMAEDYVQEQDGE